MKACVVYLNFDGNASDAVAFYRDAIGATLVAQTFAEAGPKYPAGFENKIMHSTLTKGPMTIMVSDTMPGTPFVKGTNFAVCLDCDDVPEMEKYFMALGQGGKVTQQLQDTFWGARFGQLTDKFGVTWMFNCMLK